MKSILTLILKHDYCLPDWIDVNEELLSNTNPRLAKFIIKSIPTIKIAMLSKLEETKDENGYKYPLLIRKQNVDYALNSLIQKNPNPGLVKYNLNSVKLEAIGQNSNPVYTDIIRERDHYTLDLSSNTNPLLADLIIKSKNINHGNPNPGLTDYFLNCEKHDILILRNSNPKLAQLVKDKFSSFPKRLAMIILGKNENPELANFIIKNGIVDDRNPNPGLTRLTIDEPHYENTNPKLKHAIRNLKYDYGGNPNIVDTSKFNAIVDSISSQLAET